MQNKLVTFEKMKQTIFETSAGPKTWFDIHEKAAKLAQKQLPSLGADPVSVRLMDRYKTAVQGARVIQGLTRENDAASVAEIWNGILGIIAECKILEASRAKEKASA